MQESIVVLSSKEDQITELSGALEREDYRVVPLKSTKALGALLGECPCRVVILDVDVIDVDNRFFRDLKKRNPEVHVILISARSFHPELKEAIVSHIDVCLSKPINGDELLYWVRSIFREHTDHERARCQEHEVGPKKTDRIANRHTQGDEEMFQ
jgi:DNA-binding NtrC family response regulator